MTGGHLAWFRGLPKWKQWAVGIPFIVIITGIYFFDAPRERGEPQLAILWTLLFLVATVVLTELLRPKPKLENARPLGLGDFQFPTATEGRVVPLVWGRVMIKGPNVVWYGDLWQEAIKEKVKTGLWSSETMIRGFRYHLGVQFALCRGPGIVLRRVLIDEKEVYSGALAVEGRFNIDDSELFGGDKYGSGGMRATCDFYPGTTTQTVSPYLDTADRQRVVTAATPTAPRYSGTCHIVARQYTNAAPTALDRGAYLGNSTSIQPWGFEVDRYPALMPGQGAGLNIVGVDANPVNVIYEWLINTEWGMGIAPSDIDTGVGSSFVTAAATVRTEGNGFSMILDRSTPARDFLGELQRQIDGIVFLDHRTGKWRIKLARADYNPLLIPEIVDSENIQEIRDYTRGAWEDTTNQVQVKYDKRDDEYKESYAVAHDVANAIILSGGSVLEPAGVVSTINFPGVKDSALASNLAWRELRAQSMPLARASFVVNREFWALRIGDVVAWTSARFGFTRLPMRILKIDYGRLEQNEITLTTVQDIFYYATASMGTPQPTGWVPPAVSLVAFPADEQLAFESPRGILVRDPLYSGDPDIAKVLCSARRQGSEVGFQISQRNAVGAPAGAYAEAGNVVSFMRIGQLVADLAAGTAIPTATITISPTPDSQVDLEEVFDDTVTALDLGVDLAHLIMAGDEFMLVSSAAIAGANVNLNGVYRGVLDSAQEGHTAGDDVYLIHVGAGITDTIFPNTNNVDIQLRMRSALAVFAGAVTTISLTMAKRAMRPYPPAAAEYSGGGVAYAVPDLEADGGPGLNDFGVDVEWRRRNFQTTDELNAMLADDAGVDASTEYRVRVFVDPAGANVEVYTGAWAVGAGPVFVNRLLLLNEAAAGTMARIQIEARHDYAGEVDLPSRYNVGHEVIPTSVMTPKFYLGGGLSAGTASNVYTAPANGNYTVRIGAAYATSNVEVQINGGGWAVVIAAGLTSGIFAALAADLIEVRHTVNEAPTLNLVQIEDPGAAVVAYGVLSN